MDFCSPYSLTRLSTLPAEALLEHLQRAAFSYFRENLNPRNGLVADTSRPDSPVSIAVVGLALSAYPLAVRHGWLTRVEALRSSLAALRFFASSEQSDDPMASGYKGFYYHFLDFRSGARAWRSELSMIDSALLIAGMFAASEFFSGANAAEHELRDLVEQLYRRVDWCWAQGGEATIRQGWKPECGFLHYGWEGYSEAILLYVLALGSPSQPIAVDGYRAWTATYQWENLYDHDYLYAGPLFIHQFSHAWIDFRGIRDPFMGEKRSDYFENSRRATYIQREYARHNPHGFAGYAENCWGLSACDGPSDEQTDQANERRRLFGYAARGVPYGPDDGSLSAPALLASLPFAAEIVLPALRHMLACYPEMCREGRLASSFNPGLAGADGRAWVSAGQFGLDQGIVLLMIENHCNQGLWQLMRRSPYLRTGLRRAGFQGGWLVHGERTDGRR